MKAWCKQIITSREIKRNKICAKFNLKDKYILNIWRFFLQNHKDGVWISSFVFFASYMEQSWERVFPRVSGTNLQAKRAARAHTPPWKKKMEGSPRCRITWGIALMRAKTVTLLGQQIRMHQGCSPCSEEAGKTHLTTWAKQEPRVLCSGVKTSPTIVYGTAPTPIP